MVRFCFGRQDQSDDETYADETDDDETYDDDQIHDHLSLGDARRFSYRSLQLATNNFSTDRLLGEGGYARVYRGLLPNGTEIAVKYLYNPNLQEYFRMMEIMTCIRHPNIHLVMGYCIHKSQLLLVSEYAHNGSLYDLLHNDLLKRFSWPMRVAVCIGIARGLTHLHEDANPRAVHRDIKSANILLDANFTPKITDFDLVRFFPTSNDDNDDLTLEAEAVDRTSGHFDSDSRLITRVVGTFGYIDPEYGHSGRVTQKSDVYGFGVTLLEIISGRKVLVHSYDGPNHDIVNWALNLLRDDRVLEIVDPVLTDFPTDDVRHCIDVAISCIKEESKERPSMREVTQMLEGAWNIFGRQLLETYSPHYISAASSFRSSISQTDDEGGGETEPAVSEVILSSYNTFLGREMTQIEEAGTSAAQSNAATVPQQVHVHQQQQQQLGVVVLSGTGDLVERLSQTMVFTRSNQLDFPEAIFPPFRTREFSRGGSRDLYTF